MEIWRQGEEVILVGIENMKFKQVLTGLPMKRQIDAVQIPFAGASGMDIMNFRGAAT
jgi:hypothetical protein